MKRLKLEWIWQLLYPVIDKKIIFALDDKQRRLYGNIYDNGKRKDKRG